MTNQNPYGIATPQASLGEQTPQTYIQAPQAQAPAVAAPQPGVGSQIASQVGSKVAGHVVDDAVMPWMKSAIGSAGTSAVGTGVATAAELATAGELGVGIASGAVGSSGLAGLLGGGAAAGGALAAASTAVPYVAAAYGLYSLLK